MEFVRRPSVLAALAAALLVLNMIALQADGDEGERTIQDVLQDREEELAGAGAGDAAAGDGAATGDGATADDGSAGDETTGGEGADAGEGAGEATGDGDTEAAEGDGDTAADGVDDAETGRGPLTAPTTGDYTYASSGTWSLTGGAQPVERQLPSTAIGTVSGDGDAWQIELVAGDQYTDRFDFTIRSASGLDWDGWGLDRDFGNGAETTSYGCSGDGAYYVNDADAGRMSQHGCATNQGVSSNGTIEYIGAEAVTLGDGTVVTADRLLYTYTVTGTGVSGDGRLDLWLDPATGLRVQEQRQIDTVTQSGDNEFVYAEDVEFLLQSLTAG